MSDKTRKTIAVGIFIFLTIVVSLYLIERAGSKIGFVTTTTTTTVWTPATIPRGQGL